MRLEILEQERSDRANFLYDLCDVAAIAIADVAYIKDLKEYYRKCALPAAEQKRLHNNTRRVFDAADPRTAMALAAMIGGAVKNGR